MRAFDSVILTEDLSDTLRTGTEGTIVDAYESAAEVFVVEFFDRDGKTLDVADVRASQMTVTLPDFFPGEQVALLADIPGHQLVRGQVGTIRERAGVGLYAVAFADAGGRVHGQLTLHAGQMLLLHWQPTESRQSA